MPDVNVGGQYYSVNMQHLGDLVFRVTGAIPIAESDSIVGIWYLANETYIFMENGQFSYIDANNSAANLRGSYQLSASAGEISLTMSAGVALLSYGFSDDGLTIFTEVGPILYTKF